MLWRKGEGVRGRGGQGKLQGGDDTSGKKPERGRSKPTDSWEGGREKSSQQRKQQVKGPEAGLSLEWAQGGEAVGAVCVGLVNYGNGLQH